MFKYFICFFTLTISFTAIAQDKLIIKGSVNDLISHLPLESATVYFSNVKDSTVIEYTTTDKNGNFKIVIRKHDKPVFLKVSYMGYQNYVESQKGILDNKDFGKIYLLSNLNVLKDVIIKNDSPPITVKKDTLEFNAQSFKVRPDSNVETLLKQLPGVEVDNDGKVTVNGKVVSQFLVNGKTFFSRDGSIALKNLPAEIIKKVQVSDLKTKKEELSRQEASSDDSSINFTIDNNKYKGFFGKFMGGFGSDDRYDSSFVMNYFKNKRKISVLASSNNINSSGFSMDEVFDNMGGGRNNRANNNSNGNAKGITQSNLSGLNYSDEWFKNFDSNLSYSFANTVTNNDTKSKQINFLPTASFTTDSQSKTRDENTVNKVNLEFDYKINPTTKISFVPKLNQTNSNSNTVFSSISKDENEQSLNETASKSFKENISTNFTNTINFNKAFERKTRNFSLVLSNNNSQSDSDILNQSKTVFHQTGQPNDERNQKSKNGNTFDSYSVEIEYTEPITDSLRVRFGTEFGLEKTKTDLKTFDFEDSSQSYFTVNDLLSNFTSSNQKTISPEFGFTFEKNKFTFNLNSGASIIEFDNHSFYLNKITDLNKKYSLPLGKAQLKYKIDRSKFISLVYEYSNSLPSSSQLLAVQNLSNPLNTIIGNPNLNPNEKQSLNFNFRNYDFRSRSGYSFYLKGDFYISQVVKTTLYDASRKKNTTYENVTGTYATSLAWNWNQSIKREAHVFRYGLNLNGSYSMDKGFTNAILYDAKSLGVSPKIYIAYDYGELLTIAPSYTLTYNGTSYSNYLIQSSTNVIHRVNLQTTSYWPENWVLGNDFGYTYNSKIGDGFKKDFYLWNSSLSYTFFNKSIIAKVKIYDVLNQNQAYSRTISATTIRDEENTVLKRYAMFSLTYKIQNLSGMKKAGRNDFRGDMGNKGFD